MRRSSFIILVLLAGLCSPQFSTGETPAEDFPSWVMQFKTEAATRGISSGTLDVALEDVNYLPGVIEADRRQPEFKLTLADYLVSALSEERIFQGRRLLHRHWHLLQKISSEYRVKPQYLVALWGIETEYGLHTGKVPLLSALATLAYDARRSSYFRQELLNLLRILDSGKLGKEKLFGSWAGAMGQLQFMPSTFLGYAVDGDNDGRIDLWKTRADYLGSAANYLQRSGWQGQQRWGRRVKIPQGLDGDLLGLESSAPLHVWQQRGVRLADGRALPRSNLQASLIVPDGREGEAFLVYDNYRVLLKWNKASSFAIAVGLLAERIVGDGD